MRKKFLAPLLLFATLFLVTPTLAVGNGPKYDKYVASLNIDVEEESDRFGQVIFNINPEDEYDGKYELEVEVEECLDLADSTVDVKLNDVWIGTIYIDADGNGKATFYVENISTEDTISILKDETVKLISGVWRDWLKVKGPK